MTRKGELTMSCTFFFRTAEGNAWTITLNPRTKTLKENARLQLRSFFLRHCWGDLTWGQCGEPFAWHSVTGQRTFVRCRLGHVCAWANSFCLGVVLYNCNSSSQEAEAGGWWSWGQSGLHRENFSQGWGVGSMETTWLFLTSNQIILEAVMLQRFHVTERTITLDSTASGGYFHF